MEFKSLKNIETSFRQIRLFCIVLVIGCAVVAICSVVFAFRFAEKQREKIYVLDGGKSLMLALSQDLSQNRPAEAREHVRRFHELFFTLSPEKSAIEHNVKRALLLADKSDTTITRTLRRKVFTTDSSRETSTSRCKLTAWSVTLITTLIKPRPTHGR